MSDETSKNTNQPIVRLPSWAQNTPQQPTIAVVQGMLPGQTIPAAQIAPGSFPSGLFTFPSEIVVNGGYVPPVFNASGADPSGGSGKMHIVIGNTVATSAGVTVTLTGSAAFTSSSTYYVVATASTNASTNATINAVKYSGAQFGLVTPNSASQAVDWIAIGY